MEKYYRFAGVELCIDIPGERMFAADRDLAPFRVEAVADPHYFRFTTVDALEAPCGDLLTVQPGFRVYKNGNMEIRYVGSVQDSWENAYLRAAHRDREHTIQWKAPGSADRVGISTVQTALAAEHLVLGAGGVVFHSACVRRNGRAVLFTAPSGTGKSTQAELWHSLRGARIMNGDRAVIRYVNGGIYACGLPFSGSSVYSENFMLPLEAVVYLAQAPVTTIRRLRGYEAFVRIWEGCSVNTWNQEDMAAASEIVSRAASEIPVYHMPCTPDASAVIALENALEESKKR